VAVDVATAGGNCGIDTTIGVTIGTTIGAIVGTPPLGDGSAFLARLRGLGSSICDKDDTDSVTR
jgi:hypothetical protein